MTVVVGIGSWDRSGSSILAAILGNTPGFVTLGEVNNLWHRGVVLNNRCGCGKPFASCPTWAKIMEGAFSDPEGKALLKDAIRISNRMTEHPLRALKTLWRTDHRIRSYEQALARLFAVAAKVTGAAVIVDSSKIPWHLDAASRGAHDFALVHLVRDPRGVVFSHQKVIPYDPAIPNGPLMQRQGALYTTAGWTYRNLLLSWLRMRYQRSVRIHYEDFTRAPREVIASTLGLLTGSHPELPFSSSTVVHLGPIHSVSGNPARFRHGEITIADDSVWRSELPKSEQVAISAATAPLRAVYRVRSGFRPSKAMEARDEG